MPRKYAIPGLYWASYYESDFKIQHEKLKRENNDFKDFVYDVKARWKDQRSTEFYQKIINPVGECAEGYIFSCEKLIRYIEEARELKEI